jgi:hypothetical protein
LQKRQVTILSRNRGVLQALERPGRHSGQAALQKAYEAARGLNSVQVSISSAEIKETEVRAEPTPAEASIESRWEEEILQLRRTTAQTIKGSTHREIMPTKAALRKTPRREHRQPWEISRTVGAAIRAIDTALPGPHTRILYSRPKRQAKLLAQLRTGASRLNEYLFKIGAAESAVCACGAAPESTKHFLFTCILWAEERKRMLQKWPGMCANMSFFPGGRYQQEKPGWKPCIDAVDAAVAFAAATGRLAQEAAFAAS